MMPMLRTFLARWTTKLRYLKSDKQAKPEKPQVALPMRPDLPLRERSRAAVAVPAQINGSQMGSGKL
jgi:hypothetical protein